MGILSEFRRDDTGSSFPDSIQSDDLVIVPTCKNTSCNVPSVVSSAAAGSSRKRKNSAVLSKRFDLNTLLYWTTKSMIPNERELTSRYVFHGPNKWWLRVYSTTGVGTRRTEIITIREIQLESGQPPHLHTMVAENPEDFALCTLFPPFLMRDYFANNRNVGDLYETLDLAMNLKAKELRSANPHLTAVSQSLRAYTISNNLLMSCESCGI